MPDVESYQRNGFTVTIWYDEDGESPRGEQEYAVSGLVMWGRNYNFPNDAGINLDDFHGWGEIAERLLKPYAVTDGDDADTVVARFATEQEGSEHITGLWGSDDDDRYSVNADPVEGGPVLLVLPVWVYEHSSISFSAGSRGWPFDDRWDSAQAGVAYMTAAHWANLMGVDVPWTGSEEQLARATEVLRQEVTTYGQYVNGECYGFTVTDWDGEDVEGPCGGFIGDDGLREEANMAADYAKHTVKCTGWLNRASGEIEHDKPCPVHNLIVEEAVPLD